MRMKNYRSLLAEYAVLLLILVGVPFACAWLGGYEDVVRDVFTVVPRTDDWQSRPEMLWNCRRPFRWWAFFLVGGIGMAMVAPFVLRAVRNLWTGWTGFTTDAQNHDNPVKSHLRIRKSFPWWGWVGVAVMAIGWILAWNRFAFVAPVQRFTYIPQWMGLIVALNALVWRRTGRSPLTDETGRYLTLFPVSAAFWWFFEYLNRYVWNWFYVNVGDLSPLEYVALATVSFSTVLPGIMIVAELLATFRPFSDGAFANMARVNLRSQPMVALLAVGSALGLVGIVFIPEFTYPFLWISPFMAVVLLKTIFKSPCALDEVAKGDWSRIVRFAVASLLCGFVWEMWNFNSFTKWIYAVAYVQRFHYFEMPLLGLFGYIPFGIECLVVTDAWMKTGGRAGDGSLRQDWGR